MGNIAKDINSTFPSEQVKALINIRYTANYLEHIGQTVLKPYNISEQQYNILRILKGAGKEMMVNTVRDRMVQKSPNITRLMDKMCDKKIIERTRCESDRRVVFVKITEKGLQLLERIDMRQIEKKINPLEEKEYLQLNRLLEYKMK